MSMILFMLLFVFYGNDLIGSKVVVFWDRPRGKGWFSGKILEYNTTSERHRVAYDDKTSQWHDLKFCRWSFVDNASKKKIGVGLRVGSQKRRRRRSR